MEKIAPLKIISLRMHLYIEHKIMFKMPSLFSIFLVQAKINNLLFKKSKGWWLVSFISIASSDDSFCFGFMTVQRHRENTPSTLHCWTNDSVCKTRWPCPHEQCVTIKHKIKYRNGDGSSLITTIKPIHLAHENLSNYLLL